MSIVHLIFLFYQSELKYPICPAILDILNQTHCAVSSVRGLATQELLAEGRSKQICARYSFPYHDSNNCLSLTPKCYNYNGDHPAFSIHTFVINERDF
ncbi:unnamed protein product [Larinioides sclopetarius]|uniref:Uncharacterized protein n=1 Tax=Larinioides sclopetarius TaxID=280406 RepID=A0AAV2ATU1_9ARAC